MTKLEEIAEKTYNDIRPSIDDLEYLRQEITKVKNMSIPLYLVLDSCLCNLIHVELILEEHKDEMNKTETDA